MDHLERLKEDLRAHVNHGNWKVVEKLANRIQKVIDHEQKVKKQAGKTKKEVKELLLQLNEKFKILPLEEARDIIVDLQSGESYFGYCTTALTKPVETEEDYL